MLIVGSSIDSAGSASGASVSQTVSEIFSPSMPVKAMISPASACSFSIRSSP